MTLPDCEADLGADLGTLQAYPTADGSFSLHSERFGEAFHNSAGARNEAIAKFAVPAELQRFRTRAELRILDVCVGLGYNSAAVLEALPSAAPELMWWGLELDRRPLELALAQPHFRSSWSASVLKILEQMRDRGGWHQDHSSGRLLWGDARSTMRQIADSQRFDLILLDAFSPQRCPELWSEEFLAGLAGRLAPGGRLLTYSRSAAVRASLRRHGLTLYSLRPAPGERPGWSSGTMAVRPGPPIPEAGPGWRALSAMEEEHLHTRAAVPFRDPSSADDSAAILQRRSLEQASCNLEATNAWQRRWRQDATG
jgi:tRNA U34 5-methylaminomethyl-2-thiouridine-forming methyltransferase MnmC